MTRAEFDHAAKEMTPVRPKDRSQSNYVNESYMPFIDDDGTRRIDTHTGETQPVDDTLLEALRTRERGTTVNDISADRRPSTGASGPSSRTVTGDSST